MSFLKRFSQNPTNATATSGTRRKRIEAQVLAKEESEAIPQVADDYIEKKVTPSPGNNVNANSSESEQTSEESNDSETSQESGDSDEETYTNNASYKPVFVPK